MYPLLRRAADVAVHTLQAPDPPLLGGVARWVYAQLGGKSDPLAKRVRALLALQLARELLTSWKATDVSHEEATRFVDEVAKTLASPGAHEAKFKNSHGVPEVLSHAGNAPSASMLRKALTIALGGSGAVSELGLMVSKHLEPAQNAAQWQRAWWTTWFTETLDRTYRDAVTTLEAERLLSMYFCATENHVIRPDNDMHIALEGDALHLLAIGTQFDLRRPARIATYHAPGPIGLNRNSMQDPLRAADSDSVPLTPLVAEDWQMKRPAPAQAMAAKRWFARRPRRDPSVPASVLVPSHPHNRTIARAEVRSGILNAESEGLVIARLIVQFDLGQKRPLQFTIFGLREMWAGLWILHHWLGDTLAIDATWSNTAWGFLRRRN